jgi:protein-disulfide isomerase
MLPWSGHDLISLKHLNYTVAFVNLMALGSFIALVSILKSKAKLIVELRKSESKSARIKNSPEVFSYLLHQQQRVHTPASEYNVVIGNPQASVQVSMATNLYCGPCKETHKKIAEIIRIHPDKVNFNLRFVQAQDESTRYVIAYWYRNIFKKPNESMNTEDLLSSWYELMDIDKFKAKYPASENAEPIDHMVAAHMEWVETAHVNQTPTFFVNGYKLPAAYNIDDLNILMSGISDRFEKQKMVDTRVLFHQ